MTLERLTWTCSRVALEEVDVEVLLGFLERNLLGLRDLGVPGGIRDHRAEQEVHVLLRERNRRVLHPPDDLVLQRLGNIPIFVLASTLSSCVVRLRLSTSASTPFSNDTAEKLRSR